MKHIAKLLCVVCALSAAAALLGLHAKQKTDR